MLSRLQWLGGGVLMVLGVAGCPVTDDYYIDASHAVSGATGAQDTGGDTGAGAHSGSGGAVAGMAQGGSAKAGSEGSLTTTGGAVLAGGQPAEGGVADGLPALCVPTTERCNGHDDDCDELVDELACNTNANGTTGCTGFTVSGDLSHGYMLCTGLAKDFSHAKEACAGQAMRLAWLESAAENTAVAATIKKLTAQTDILFGATDQAREGDWLWDGAGGFQFWKGAENGGAVGGNFDNWAAGTPNDANGGEDCVVMNPSTALWGDRTCSANYSYLCEDLSP